MLVLTHSPFQQGDGICDAEKDDHIEEDDEHIEDDDDDEDPKGVSRTSSPNPEISSMMFDSNTYMYAALCAS